MKPADHPEFFRRPPPDGRSRESSIALDAEGCFWHSGQRVEHKGMQRAFASWIRKHPDDGRFILCNGYDWTYFTVQDVPFYVVSVEPQGDQLSLALSDQSRELLDPTTLRVGARDALYLRVKQGQFDARFSRHAQAALEPYVVERSDGSPGLRLGGRTVALPT
jgi:hypothetical protein